MYVSKRKIAYLFDSSNSFLDDKTVITQLAQFWPRIQLGGININYDTRVDFCAASLAAAVLEVIRHYKQSHIPNSINLSITNRKRFEKSFFKTHGLQALSRAREVTRKLGKIPKSTLTCPTCRHHKDRRGFAHHVQFCNPPSNGGMLE